MLSRYVSPSLKNSTSVGITCLHAFSKSNFSLTQKIRLFLTSSECQEAPVAEDKKASGCRSVTTCSGHEAAQEKHTH